MLSRHADAAFWIGRYIERAEATARMIDVHYHFGLESPVIGEALRWSSILAISGQEELYREINDTEDERSILQFFGFEACGNECAKHPAAANDARHQEAENA